MIYHKNCLLIKGGRGFEDLNSLLRYLIFMRLWSPLLMKINFLTSDRDNLLRVTKFWAACDVFKYLRSVLRQKHIFDLVDGWTQASLILQNRTRSVKREAYTVSLLLSRVLFKALPDIDREMHSHSRLSKARKKKPFYKRKSCHSWNREALCFSFPRNWS